MVCMTKVNNTECILKFDHTLLSSPRILELFDDDGSDE